MSHWNVLALIGVGSVLAACNSKSSGGSTASDAGFTGDAEMSSDTSIPGDSGESADSGGATDTGSTGDSGATTCPGGPDGGGLAYKGVVELSRVGLPTPVRYNALAQIEPTASYPPTGFTGTLVGACCYGTTPSDAGLPTLESAGNITITDGTSTLATLMSGSYVASSTTDPTLTWLPGAMLKVTASGGTVGAFTATVAAPPYFTGVSPAFNAPITVHTSADLVVSWTPSKRPCSKITVGLTQGALQPSAGCVVDDSAGTVTIPASMLGMFTATSGTAVIERVEGTDTLASNAEIGVVVINVQTTTTMYTP